MSDNIKKWADEKVAGEEGLGVALKLLTMTDAELGKFIGTVIEKRAEVRNKKEAVDFAKEVAKDVLIPLLKGAAK